MNESAIRNEIVEMGKRLFLKGFVAANDGNISARVSRDEMIITPTGVSKGFMDVEDLVKVRISTGEVVEGLGKPSSETRMHLAVYQRRDDVRAVVHAHPPVATGFAVAGLVFDKVTLPEAVLGLGRVALTEYATPTTEQVAKVVIEKIDYHDVLLLANHGALTVGSTVTQAYFRMETLEQVAKITWVARLLGNENALTHAQQQELYRIRQR